MTVSETELKLGSESKRLCVCVCWLVNSSSCFVRVILRLFFNYWYYNYCIEQPTTYLYNWWTIVSFFCFCFTKQSCNASKYCYYRSSSVVVVLVSINGCSSSNLSLLFFARCLFVIIYYVLHTIVLSFYVIFIAFSRSLSLNCYVCFVCKTGSSNDEHKELSY